MFVIVHYRNYNIGFAIIMYQKRNYLRMTKLSCTQNANYYT